MPTFGEYETIGDSVETTYGRDYIATIWHARKVGAKTAQPTHVLNHHVPLPRTAVEPLATDALEPDRNLEFLESVKQLDQARQAGGRCLVPVRAFNVVDQGAYYVTDFYPRTLKTWISGRVHIRSAALQHAIHSIVSGCLALQRSCHRSHGNLKPSNVLIGKRALFQPTAIALTEPLPPSALRLAGSDVDDRRDVAERIRRQTEFRDLRAIGELILQLIEGRLMSGDYNYPVSHSPAWDVLGKQGERWRRLCNRLLDPRLSLNQENLEALEKELRPSKTPIIGVAIGVTVFTGLLIYLLLAKEGPPRIKAQPAPVTAEVGSNAVLRVTARGNRLSYQWLKNGIPIADATNDTYRISAVSRADGGDYSVLVSNRLGRATSTIARLTARILPPTIVTQPQRQVVRPGTNAAFAVAARGPGPLRYQWRFEGNDLPDQTNATLQVANITTNDAGSYAVVVWNDGGTANSQPATLTVEPPPTPPSLVAQLRGQIVAETSNVTLTVEARGTPPLRYQWRLNGNDLARETNAVLRMDGIRTDQAGRYSIVVSNAAGATNSNEAMVTVTPLRVRPRILSHLKGVTVTEGDTASFAVAAQGTEPLAYQWRYNGANLAGETNATLRLVSVTTSRSGLYSVAVSNAAGSSNSLPAALNVSIVIVPPSIVSQPQPQSVNEGGTVRLTVDVSGTEPLRYQWQQENSLLAGATNATLELCNVRTNQAGRYSVRVTNLRGTNTSAPALLTVVPRPLPPSITAQPQPQLVKEGTNIVFKVAARGTEPLRYQWRRNGEILSGQTNSTLELPSVRTNQAGIYRVTVTNLAGTSESQAAELTVEARPTLPRITVQPQTQTVAERAEVVLRVEAQGTGPFRYQWRFRGADLAGQTNAALQLTAVSTNATGRYMAVVSNAVGNSNSEEAILTVTPLTQLPNVTVQPQSQTVQEGASLRLSVEARGTGPLRYQWRFNNNELSGETSESLVLSSVGPGHSGIYSVSISNPAGTTNSQPAAVTVTARPAPPGIVTQPANHTAQEGETVTFGVDARGQAPLRYQWRRNGTDLPGETGPALRLVNVTSNDAGSYSVAISNVAGATNSQGALLLVETVRHAPELITQPRSQSASEGANVSFTVEATGSLPLNYQWLRNDQPLLNQTNPTLALIAVKIDHAGSYSVLVRNPAGLVTSQSAVLTVNPKSAATSGGEQVVPLGDLDKALERYEWNFNTHGPGQRPRGREYGIMTDIGKDGKRQWLGVVDALEAAYKAGGRLPDHQDRLNRLRRRFATGAKRGQCAQRWASQEGSKGIVFVR
ncbi:MAG: immunoglobulin domain-containing protein [Verrucomicrobiota bacterium]